MLRKFGLLIGMMLCLGGVSSAQTPLFDFQKIADGVYAALARPQYKLNCNAAVIVNEDGVLIVDSHSKPSAARALINQLKTITHKPVRYVVNSHFHWDHAQGNQAYPAAFPKDVTIISSEATRENIINKGIPSVRQQLDQMPAEIADLRKRIAAEGNSAAATKLKSDLSQAESYLAELRTMQVTLPEMTFDKSLILHKKTRDLFILFLGRGHTSGDAVVYLPAEKVVATGDLLHGWMPFMADGFPPEWVATLDRLSKLSFDHIIGGHGDVKPKSHLTFFRNYLADLIEETRKARQRGETLQQAQKSVAAALASGYEGGMAGRFNESIGANVEKVYKDLEAKLY
ncbi:MAG TPA: MBL fold metallo-hydrolase [Acidobacteriota bacterium]|jgi:glyoxylase-like metal-dependent hydrolase (beta-lactamase superfamily II)